MNFIKKKFIKYDFFSNYMHTFLTEILDPLSQFQIRDLLYLDAPLIGNIHISITNIGFYLIVSLVFIMIMNLLSTNYNKLVSNNWSISIETLFFTIHKIVIEQINQKKGRSVCYCPVGENPTLQIKRYYSTSLIKNENKNVQFHPWFITGFVDGEGCFSIKITSNNQLNTGWRVRLSFYIGIHLKDLPVLVNIHNYLGVGRIYNNQNRESTQLEVQSIKEIAVIIQHFDKYPLLTQKFADYLIFKEVYCLIKNNEHLTVEGLNKIAGLKEQQNWGLPSKLESLLPNRIMVKRPEVKNQTIKDPNWLIGFVSGEGCFLVVISKSPTHSIGFKVQIVFKITQHMRDEQLIISFIKYLDCGSVTKKGEALDFIVTRLSDITNKIIPFFQNYIIEGVKSKDFEDWCRVAKMMKEGKHLTKNGLEQIKKIKAGMNRGGSTL